MEAKKMETVLAGPAWAPHILLNGGAASAPAMDCPRGILSRTLTGLRKWLGMSSHIARLTYEREQLKQQNRAYQAEVFRMRQSEQQVRALRHDMKNHLAVVRQYAAAGQTEELGRYLDRCLEQLAQPGFVHTGNPDIDSMLNYKLAQAERAGARLTLDIRLPEDFTADAFDWNIILGSLLDHAVEALEKSREKRLSLSLRVDRGIFYLKMAYSDDGPAPESEGAGGLGGSLVQRAIDKYHGTLDVDHAGQICTVAVMLYLEP